MDERAKIPVSLPRDNPTQAYWQNPPDEIADHQSTKDLPETADVVIVGSGISGAAIAWGLLQGDAPGSIVMLEARQACSGATGRNGGHTKAASYRSFPDHAAQFGTPFAVQIARMELANILAEQTFIREHAIDCDLNACDTVDAIYDPAQWERAQEAVASMRKAMPDRDPAARYKLYTRKEMQEIFYCHERVVWDGREEKLCGGVGYFAGSLSAYKFGIGVLKMCLRKGLNLQTNTPALEVGKNKDGDWDIRTPRGTITAKRLVVATNGYTAHLLPQFQGVIVPLRGQITAHRPGLSLPHAGCLPRTYSFIYEKGYEYMIPRPAASRFAGDIVIGGGLARAPDDGLREYGTTDDTTVNPAISTYLRGTTARYFGPRWGADDAAGRIRAEWTGIMGYSPDGFPFVGEMPGEGNKNLFVSCSFQGHGMVFCWTCARALVEMMAGHDGEELRAWFPDAFRPSAERLAKKFQGRLHTSAGPVERTS